LSYTFIQDFLAKSKFFFCPKYCPYIALANHLFPYRLETLRCVFSESAVSRGLTVSPGALFHRGDAEETRRYAEKGRKTILGWGKGKEKGRGRREDRKEKVLVLTRKEKKGFGFPLRISAPPLRLCG